MGPLESVLGMIPGLDDLKQAAEHKPDEKQMSRIEAILSSMTAGERRDHSVMNGSRRKRIASGSGASVVDVNRLLKQFTEMRRMLQMMGQGGMPGVGKGMKMPRGLRSGSAPSGFGSGKKRKKSGPWGLIRTR